MKPEWPALFIYVVNMTTGFALLFNAKLLKPRTFDTKWYFSRQWPRAYLELLAEKKNKKLKSKVLSTAVARKFLKMFDAIESL